MDLERLIELYKYDPTVVYDLVRAYIRQNEVDKALAIALKEDIRIALGLVSELFAAGHPIEWVIDNINLTDPDNYPRLLPHISKPSSSVPDLSVESVVTRRENPYKNLNIGKYRRGVMLHGVYVPVFWTKSFARLCACDFIEFIYSEEKIDDPNISLLLEHTRLYVEDKPSRFPIFLEVTDSSSLLLRAARMTQIGSSYASLCSVYEFLSGTGYDIEFKKILVDYYLGNKVIKKLEYPKPFDIKKE